MWKRIVIDEPDSIRISAMECLQAQFTWYITATSNKLKNIRGHGYLKKVFSKMSNETIKRRIINMEEEYNKYLHLLNKEGIKNEN